MMTWCYRGERKRKLSSNKVNIPTKLSTEGKRTLLDCRRNIIEHITTKEDNKSHLRKFILNDIENENKDDNVYIECNQRTYKTNFIQSKDVCKLIIQDEMNMPQK